MFCVFTFQSTSGLTVKKEVSGLHVGMDNKENKNRAHGSVGMQIKGPMDSYIISQQKKSTGLSGKFLSTSDSCFNVKFGSSKLKTGAGMDYCVCTVCLKNGEEAVIKFTFL
jgi:hypothetical protein